MRKRSKFRLAPQVAADRLPSPVILDDPRRAEVVVVANGESPVEFWRGDFGNAYLQRNNVDWQKRVPFWRHILELTHATSFLEIGCNAGHNFQAIRSLDPEAIMSGVDVNQAALDQALNAGFDVELAEATQIVDLFGMGACQLSVSSGVLIHVPPEDLKLTMAAMRDVSSAYVLAIEYEAPEEQEIEYRGHHGKLWRRPFGQLYQRLGLSLVETGVADGFGTGTDCIYWLLEKS